MGALVGSGAIKRIPDLLHTRVVAFRIQIRILDRELVLWRRSSETCKQLAPIPGVRAERSQPRLSQASPIENFLLRRDLQPGLGLCPSKIVLYTGRT